MPDVLVLGASGLVGSAFVGELTLRGYAVRTSTRPPYDLRDPRHVEQLFTLAAGEGVRWVVLAAARVGGIGANLAEPAEMLLDNLRIQNNVIEAAVDHGIERLLFLGSSCVYPRAPAFAQSAADYFREDDLGTGPLEPSNRAYAMAKLAGIELCRAMARPGFKPIVLMPPNLHGHPRWDHYGPRSHVLQALVQRLTAARDAHTAGVVFWGTGTPRREFLRVEEVARAGVRLLEREKLEHDIYNVGHGYDLSISALATRVAARVGYDGGITFFGDAERDGVPHKTMDSTRLRNELGWAPRASMLDEIDQSIDEYLDARATTR